MMTLEELKQIKQDLDNGIVVSRATWIRVLDETIQNMVYGPVGFVSQRGEEKVIMAAFPAFVDEEFVDRLPVGTMVMAPGVDLGDHG